MPETSRASTPSTQLVDLLHAGDRPALGTHVERKVTILFLDIRGFTSLSERMSPQQNFEFINAFFGHIAPVVEQHGGIIDKFIGDAIMAVFPGSADSAVDAALAMQAKAEDYNANQPAGTPPVRIGMGLNTGIVMIGTVGVPDRMDCTVIGDAVNLASRLESTTKTYAVPLVISEATLNNLAAPDKYDVRFVDRIRVKGKTRPQSVYEVFDHETRSAREAKAATLEDFEKAVAYYHLKRIGDAQALIDSCMRRAPDDAVARLYDERCRRFVEHGTHEGTGELDRDVEWRASYALGIDIVDEQHQELLRNINHLSAMIRDERADAVADILRFLGEYAAVHFRTEEELMTRYGYPFLKEHQEEHGRFVETYLALVKEIESGKHDKFYLLFKIDIFLVDWLINHTTSTDKHFGRYVHTRINVSKHVNPTDG